MSIIVVCPWISLTAIKFIRRKFNFSEHKGSKNKMEKSDDSLEAFRDFLNKMQLEID